MNITVSPTPNPNSMKLTLDRKVVESGSRSYVSRGRAEGDPLATALFAIPGVANVFMLNDFITVTKDSMTEWESILPAAEAAIRRHLAARPGESST